MDRLKINDQFKNQYTYRITLVSLFKNIDILQSYEPNKQIWGMLHMYHGHTFFATTQPILANSDIISTYSKKMTFQTQNQNFFYNDLNPLGKYNSLQN